MVDELMRDDNRERGEFSEHHLYVKNETHSYAHTIEWPKR